MRMNPVRAVAMALFFAAAPFLAACGDEATPQTSAAVQSETTAETTPSVEPTGEIIEVRMTAAGGGAFEPSELTARQGDVIRFVNVEDVHNISWPAGQNPSGANLPPTSPFFTAPGETHDVLVEMEPGSYFFQCDPHVPMGMVGTLEVID